MIDYNKAVEIADRVWWVGSYLKDDIFQCHVYLIENGDQSILIDPGSVLTFKETLKKIKSVTTLENIKYIVCHHQDPDITGALPLFEKLIKRDDVVIYTHARAINLLKHLGLKTPFKCVEANGWVLVAGSRKVEFIFTPYMHFPGAFCTYDRDNQILFSSDIFGGFSKNWSLFARDESYFEDMRLFHEHYMPSRDIVVHALNRVETYPIKLIAPQHGSIIPENLIKGTFNYIKNLECGLYLMTHTSTDIKKLSNLHKLLKDFLEVLTSYTEFKDIISMCLVKLNEAFKSSMMKFYIDDNGLKLFYTTDSSHRDSLQPLLNTLFDQLKSGKVTNWIKHDSSYLYIGDNLELTKYVVLPLYDNEKCQNIGLALFYIPFLNEIDNETKSTLIEISKPLSVAIEREILFRSLDNEREKFYIQSTKDPLTGLFTRYYMRQTVVKLLSIHNRNESASFAIMMLDIDFFKKINDNFGHSVGDLVLKKVGKVIIEECRIGDIPVRFGGEEFLIFAESSSLKQACAAAQRIRARIEESDFSKLIGDNNVTVSIGVVFHKQEESLDHVIERADSVLYKAKKQGRNRVLCD